jgi:3-oxoacyl-[acyl-carrier protein] reductase
VLDNKNKAVIITGGTRGIGRSLSLAIARKGYNVASLYKSNEKEASALEKEAKESGLIVRTYKVSVFDHGSVSECIAEIKGSLGRVYALINNAGITRDGYLMMMKENDWNDVINTNLIGTLTCTGCVIPYLKDNGEGVIINMSSTAGYLGTSGQTNYSATKSAIIGFTRGLAVELIPNNILVYGIAPGFIGTEMLDSIPPKTLDQYINSIPMKRPGRTDEIGELAVNLVEKKFSYSTGQIFLVDGGLSLI